VRTGLPLVFILFFLVQVSAQTPLKIAIHAEQTPLDEVLLKLKESYGFQFAFDEDLLSQYQVTANRVFPSVDEALAFLIRPFPLVIEKADEVYLIIPQKKEEKQETKNKFTQISGQVLEAGSYEPLPFSYILINGKPVQSDQQGNFSFLAAADTSYRVRISHLGYFIYDTLLTQGINKRFLLTPHVAEINEVLITGNPVEKSTLIGDKPGKIKLNHRIAPVLPGHGDNSVFNLLRLMPGILAAGEQSTDLLIWGSYESHSEVLFDGFTVFGLKNFNDNISVVNPFMIKDIEIYKGGYEARYGGRVGGIVDITGKNGTLLKPTFTFNINNTTLNSLVEVPLSKKSSLMAAYRQTYYELYDPTTLLFNNQNSGMGRGITTRLMESGVDFAIVPKYNFRDANLKYAYNQSNGSQFYVSLYGGGDRFFYHTEGDLQRIHFSREEEEKNKQFGSSAFFEKPWKNGDITQFIATYSVYERRSGEANETENTRFNVVRHSTQVTSDNHINEAGFKAEHSFSFAEGHKLLWGTGFRYDYVQLLRTSYASKIINLNTQATRLYSYLQDVLPVGKFLQFETGVRAVYAVNLKNYYIEPRLAATVKLTKEVKLNAAWGLYNQFMAKTPVVDSTGNYTYYWTNSDEKQIPVLHAEHRVAGISYNKNGFTFSTEGYYKTTSGLTRFYNGSNFLTRGFYEGDNRSYGLDFFVKKEYKRQMAWISYTLSRTEEHFPFYGKNVYRPAPQDQLHEVKVAGIFNYKSFYFSSNFVYGSGFDRFRSERPDGEELNQDYKRLDVAVIYKFPPKKVKTEIGISVLNVLNTSNIKYANLQQIPADDIDWVGIYAEAVPFTPTLFLKVVF